DPLRGLSRAERDRFDRGKVVFDSVFTPETGLGPLFNSTGCGECHEGPAGGRGDEVEVHATAFHAPVCDPLAQEGGPVIQQHTTPALKQARSEEHTSELQSHLNLVCRLLLEKKKQCATSPTRTPPTTT